MKMKLVIMICIVNKTSILCFKEMFETLIRLFLQFNLQNKIILRDYYIFKFSRYQQRFVYFFINARKKIKGNLRQTSDTWSLKLIRILVPAMSH